MKIFIPLVCATADTAWCTWPWPRTKFVPFVRRLFRYQECNTVMQRMGTVIRVSQVDLSVWHLHAEQAIHIAWIPSMS